jgi:feruloyl-CoA synthase
VTPFVALEEGRATDAVEAAHAALTPDSIGKLLFTSGTTGMPKAVIFPQRMLTSQRQQVAQTFRMLLDEPARMVDWLPWHHPFGGTHNSAWSSIPAGTSGSTTGAPCRANSTPRCATCAKCRPTSI